MRITLELEPADVECFLRTLAREVEECDVLDAAKQALDTLLIGNAPSYVRKRIVAVQRLILMLKDEAWALPQPVRTQVLETRVYFSDPEDLIPDDIELIGLLDDAIVLDILLRRLRHTLGAYVDFCEFRQISAADDRTVHPGRLARRRDALRARMRRRAQSEPITA